MESLSPQVVSAAKLPILNPNEFDLWKMRIEQYFLMTDYSLWEVILNGDSPIPTRVIEGVVQPVAPTTAEQRLARKNELKARGTLLMALPDKHQLKFNIHKDAKTLTEAIEKSTNEPVSVVASVSAASAKIIVSALPNADTLSNAVIYSFFASQSNSSQLDNDDLKQIDADDLEEIDLKWQMAMLTVRARRFFQRTRRNLGANGTTSIGLDMSKVKCYNCHKKGHFARECMLPKDTKRNDPVETQRRSIPVETSTSNALVSQCDAYDRYQSREGCHDVPPPYTGTFMPPKPDLAFHDAPNVNETVHNAFNVELSPTKPDKDNAPSFVQPIEQVKTLRPSVKIVEHPILATNLKTAILKPKTQGNSRNRKACFVCKSLTHLIKDCDYYKKMAQTPVRNHAQRGNHQYYASMTHLNPQRHVVPTAVLTKSKLVPLTAARPVTTAVPHNNVTRPRPAKTVGNQQYALKDKGVIDSRCSRHMTRNMSYLSDFEEINGGYVAFGGNPKGGKITGKGKIKTSKLDFDDVYFVKELTFNLFSVSQMCDKKNSVLFTDTECIVLSPEFKLPNKNQVLLRVPRENNMYNVDLKNIVPSGDLTCLFAKATLVESNLWHRRELNQFCGMKGIKRELNQFYGMKGIKREFSVPRTPQQNGLAERKNKTLIEAVRTMLADLLLPIPFWAEVVNTACYVQNRVLVTKPHDKTLYELLLGRTPSIGFMRPFGCHVTILNTLDLLGKFDGKADERFLVGYSVSSKAFRVFNSRTRIAQETLHINFLENKPNVAGSDPTWLFDIDTLTKSMNYQPVTNTDDDAAFKVKEPEFKVEKPESEVYVSLSSSAKIKKHDDKTKRKAKGKNPVELSTGYRNLSAEFEDFSDNNINEVNAAGTPVPAIGKISTNSTNAFSAAGPSNTVVSPTLGESSNVDPSQYPDDPNMPALEDITYSDDEEDVGVEADFSNLETTITVSPILTTRVHKDHHVTQIIGDLSLATQTRSMTRMVKDQGFKDPDYPDKVYKVVKALYGLHQAPRACRSQMGISKDKYIAEILRKFGLTYGKSASTPIDTDKPLLKDPDGEDVDVHTYRSMIGSLMYLTLSRPDIMFAVYACARF
uniref:Ribonuclease H-like domain-containing protein n=1 Tax=Tanacetum cinerariifolium TaxID=118510 RepID=A0A6L2LNC6_TANCI|nr:ribonuclease H-like domain-containing protein [Tanacetum cinerariifolium]